MNPLCYRRGGMHCCGSGWNVCFTRIGKTGFKTERGAVRQLRDLIAWIHGTAFRYSMENAVLEAAGQLEQSLEKENILVQELRRMRHKMMISVPVNNCFRILRCEAALTILRRSGVLVIAKRTGGNVCEIFRIRGVFCTRIDTMRKSVRLLPGGSSRILCCAVWNSGICTAFLPNLYKCDVWECNRGFLHERMPCRIWQHGCLERRFWTLNFRSR